MPMQHTLHNSIWGEGLLTIWAIGFVGLSMQEGWYNCHYTPSPKNKGQAKTLIIPWTRHNRSPKLDTCKSPQTELLFTFKFGCCIPTKSLHLPWPHKIVYKIVVLNYHIYQFGNLRWGQADVDATIVQKLQNNQLSRAACWVDSLWMVWYAQVQQTGTTWVKTSVIQSSNIKIDKGIEIN